MPIGCGSAHTTPALLVSGGGQPDKTETTDNVQSDQTNAINTSAPELGLKQEVESIKGDALSKIVMTPEKELQIARIKPKIMAAMLDRGFSEAQVDEKLQMWARDGYHSLDHLEFMVDFFLSLSDITETSKYKLLEFAVYHDVDYQGKPGQDEDNSIKVNRQDRLDQSIPPDEEIEALIEESKSCEYNEDWHAYPDEKRKMFEYARMADLGQATGCTESSKSRKLMLKLKWEWGVWEDYKHVGKKLFTDGKLGRPAFIDKFRGQAPDLISPEDDRQLAWLREQSEAGETIRQAESGYEDFAASEVNYDIWCIIRENQLGDPDL